MQFTKQQIDEHVAALPSELKDAMFDDEIAKKLIAIGKKFGLTIEKTGFLSEETGYIVLGLARPSEFVANLSQALGVDTEKARLIASEINHQILFGLREALKAAHQIDFGEEELQKKPIVAPPRMMPPPLSNEAKIPPINLRPQSSRQDLPDKIPARDTPATKPISIPPKEAPKITPQSFPIIPPPPTSTEKQAPLRVPPLGISSTATRSITSPPAPGPRIPPLDLRATETNKIVLPPTPPKISTPPVAEPKKTTTNIPEKPIIPNNNRGGDPYREPIE